MQVNEPYVHVPVCVSDTCLQTLQQDACYNIGGDVWRMQCIDGFLTTRDLAALARVSRQMYRWLARSLALHRRWWQVGEEGWSDARKLHQVKSVMDVVWPRSLQCLSFGERFNSSLEGVKFPSSLRQLQFDSFFNLSEGGLLQIGTKCSSLNEARQIVRRRLDAPSLCAQTLLSFLKPRDGENGKPVENVAFS